MPGPAGRLRLPSLGTESPNPTICKEHRRVVVMGAAKVGKTSIIQQFLYDKFTPKYRQTVEELHRGEYEIQDGVSLILDLLDTSGAFQFPAMRALSISTASAFILVYAIDDEQTWEEVRRLREQILEARGSEVPIVVVGNKEDLARDEGGRQVPREIAETTVLFNWECGYVECSAKENTHVMDVFKQLLVQAKIRYNLSPAVRRRRQSLPNYTSGGTYPGRNKNTNHRNSCAIA